MPERPTRRRGVLYVIVCAAGPARDVPVLVELAQQAGWDVCCVVTPYARRFVDMPRLEGLTGHPVRSDDKLPDEPDVLPPADAMIVAPASFNTINKWAAGVSDTLALGLITEAIGEGLPIVARSCAALTPERGPSLDDEARRDVMDVLTPFDRAGTTRVRGRPLLEWARQRHSAEASPPRDLTASAATLPGAGPPSG